MNIQINKSLFWNNRTYTINDDIEILLYSKYLSSWNGYILPDLKQYDFNDDNCLIIVFNVSGDEYLYLWDIETDKIYDMDCNDKFELTYERGIYCIISGLCYRALIGYNL